MFTGTAFTSFAALLCFSFNIIDARIVQRDVVSPPITYPTAGTIWNVNDRHNVTWDTSVIPPGTTSSGMIVLGFLDAADGDNEHLDLNNPLATGFPITAGRAEITVPSVTTRDTYILVLFGDSGNASGKFTIQNISISSPPSSTVAPASSSVSSASAATAGNIGGASSGQSQGASSAALSSGVASSSQNGVGLGSATGTAAAVQGSPTAPSSSASAAASSAASSVASSVASSSVATTHAQPTAQSGTTTSNAGTRTISYGGTATWISTICSLAVILGLTL